MDMPSSCSSYDYWWVASEKFGNFGETNKGFEPGISAFLVWRSNSKLPELFSRSENEVEGQLEAADRIFRWQ